MRKPERIGRAAAARGLIYDRDGRPLAINVPSYVVRIRPADLPFPDRDAVVGELSTLLDIPSSQIIQQLDSYANRQFDQVQIASDVPSDVARILIEDSRNLPGVAVTVDERREYEYGSLMADMHWLQRPGVGTMSCRELSGLGYLGGDRSAAPASSRATRRAARSERGAAGRA